MNSCESCRYAAQRERQCKAAGGMPKYLNGGGCPLYAMSARAFLERVTHAKRRIESMQEQAQHYRDMALRVTADIASPGRGSGLRAHSRVEESVTALDALAQDIERRAQEMRIHVAQTMEVIDRIEEPVWRELLELRYLCDMGWEDIAERMKYEVRQVYRVHAQALQLVQREMDRLGLSGMKHPLSYSPMGSAQAAVPVQ